MKVGRHSVKKILTPPKNSYSRCISAYVNKIIQLLFQQVEERFSLKSSLMGVVLLSGFTYVLAACAQTLDDDFDVICVAAELALAETGRLAAQARMEKTVSEGVKSEDVRNAITVIGMVDPPLRYPVFVEAAEDVLGRPWACEPLEKLFVKSYPEDKYEVKPDSNQNSETSNPNNDFDVSK